MRDSQVTEQLVLRWVPVVDERGRTHMEMRWSAAPEATASTGKPHAA